MLNIQARYDKGYNIWCQADLVLPANELVNYSSDWVIVGTATSYNRAMAFANDFLMEED